MLIPTIVVIKLYHIKLTFTFYIKGGTAGAAALITEQLGQVVAALSFDSEYKRVGYFLSMQLSSYSILNIQFLIYSLPQNHSISKLMICPDISVVYVTL